MVHREINSAKKNAEALQLYIIKNIKGMRIAGPAMTKYLMRESIGEIEDINESK